MNIRRYQEPSLLTCALDELIKENIGPQYLHLWHENDGVCEAFEKISSLVESLVYDINNGNYGRDRAVPGKDSIYG